MEGVWELQAWSICYFTASHPPSSPKYVSGTNFFNLTYLFWVDVPLSFFCPETMDKLFIWGEKKNCLNHTNDNFVCNT